MRLVWAALLAGGCGRIAFDPLGDGGGNGSGTIDALVGDGGTVGTVTWASSPGVGLVDLRALGVGPDGSASMLVRVSTTLDLGNGTVFTNTGRDDLVIVAFDPAGNVRWGRQFVDTYVTTGILIDGQQALAVDGNGNITMAGEFANTVDFGTGPKTSAGADDIAVVSVSSDNVVRWVHTFGATTSESVSGIATAPDNSVWVSGDFASTVDFGGGPLTPAGMGDVFLVHYAGDGTFAGAYRYGGAGDDVLCDVAVADRVALTGFFSGTSNFGTGNVTSAGSLDAFYGVYSTTGVAMAAGGQGGTLDDVGWSVALSSSVLVFGGTFSGSFTSSVGPLTSAGGRDAFTSVGPTPTSPTWIWHGGDTGDDEVTDVALDAAGNVYMTGFFQGTITIGQPITSAGGRDGFVASFTPAGTLRWAKSWGTAGTDEGRRLAIRPDGSVALAGMVGGSFDFDGHTIGGTNQNAFVLVLR